MPKKKTTSVRKTAQKTTLKRTIPNSYMSLLYGVITVFVLFLIVVFGMRVVANQQKGDITDESPSTTVQAILREQRQSQNQYTVVEGDSLWSIAENQLNDGFAWSEIAKANNISDPSQIEKGMKLTLPNTGVRLAQANLNTQQVVPSTPGTDTTTTENKSINNSSYVVQHGDTLWDIAVKSYGDGYKWSVIAQANNLSDPNIIHAENKLTIPRG